MKVSRYLLCIVFADRSMYIQLKTDAFKEDFSKNTVYRFLDNPKTNWKKFTTLLSERVINGFFRRLTSDERNDVFIIDDSLFDRSTSKKTEMLAKGFAGFIPEISEMSIKCPMWLLVGEHDKTGKVMAYNKMWHKKEGVPLYIIEGAAHNANDDQPKRVNELLNTFLQAL